MTLDISSLLSQVALTNQQIAGSALDVQTATQGMVSAINNSADQYTSIGNADALATTTAGYAKVAKEDANVATAQSLGVDSGDSTGMQAKHAATLIDAQAKAQDLADTIAQKRSINFMDDPVGWVQAKMSVGNDIEEYNAQAMRANTAENSILQLNQAMTAQSQNNANQMRTTSVAAVDAEAQKVQAQAAINADHAKVQAYLYQSDGAKTLASMSAQELNSLATGFHAELMQEQNGIALANSQRAQEEFDWRKRQKELGDQANSVLINEYNAGVKAWDPTRTDMLIDPNNLTKNGPGQQMLKLISGKTEYAALDPAMRAFVQAGQTNQLASADGSVRVLGTDAASAYNMLRFNPNLSLAQQTSANLIKQAAQSLSDPTATDTQSVQFRDPKTPPEVKRQLLDAEVKTLANGQALNNNDPKSIYYLPPLQQIVKATPGLADTPLYQKVLAPLAQTGVDLTADKVYNLGATAVAAGTLTPTELASSMKTIYTVAQLRNMESNGASTMFGINPKLSYNVNIGGKIVDVTGDTSKLTNAISRDLVSRQMDYTQYQNQ